MIKKINYADKTVGGKFTASDANEIKTSINSNADVLSENSQLILSLQGGSLGSIKPTDAAPTPGRNGNYTFSIGGNKPAWLTAEAGITTVNAGDGVAVVYTAPDTYSYTHVDVSSDFVTMLTTLDGRATTLEKDLYNKRSIVQTHISEQDGYLGVDLQPDINWKTRIFDLTDIKSIRVQLGNLFGSNANAFAFYSVTTGFSSANYISGMSYENFSAAERDVTVDVPTGALRLLVSEMNANISTYTITDESPDIGNSKTTTLEGRATTLEGRATTLEGRATTLEGRATTLDGRATTLEGRATTLESDMYDSILEPKTSISVIPDKIFYFSGGQQVLSGFNINIFSLDEKYIEIDLSCSNVGGSGGSMAYGFFNSTTEFTVETLISGVSFTQMIAAWTNIFAGKRIKIPFGAKSFAFVDMSSITSNWSINVFYYDKTNDKITDLKEYVEEQVTFIDNAVQTHISEQNGFLFTTGTVYSDSNWKTRVFDLTNIKSIRVQLGNLFGSNANAFAFYSVTTGFSSANYISGMSYENFSAAERDVTVDVPTGALRLLVSEMNANISTYTITGYFAASRMDNFDERITEIEEIVNDNIVACRGDSITAATYPTNLQNLLGTKYSVQNLGVGSAWIQDIAARQGGVPFLLLNDLEIPADNTTEITIPSMGVFNKYQSTGTQVAPIFNLSTAMLEYSPCMIDNEEFIMTLTNPGSGYNANVTIRRVNAGNAFTIKAGTPIYPNSLNVYREVLATVFFMGTNNTQSYTADLNTHADTIINYHKDCLKLLNNSNYLILGLFNLSQRLYTRDQASSPVTDSELLAQNVSYELKMQNEFGLHFINLRKYLSSPKSIKDAVKLGYMTQATADTNAANDATWQNKGCAAYSFMNYNLGVGVDYTHPNTAGYKMISWYVFNALKKIGI